MGSGKNHLVVMANTASGRGEANDLARRVADAARSEGFGVALVFPESARESLEACEAAVADEADRVVCVGGDGLVHAVLPALVGSRTALAIVAAGTGNDAQRGLGLARGDSWLAGVVPGSSRRVSIARALSAPAAVDLLICSPRNDPDLEVPVLTIAAAGFPVAVNRRANAMKRPRGSLRYTAATLAELPGLDAPRLTLTLEGGAARPRTLQQSVSLLAIANTVSFGGGTKIAPEAEPDDGLAEVVVVDDAPRRDYLRLLPAAMFGKHTGNRHVDVARAETVVVEPTDTPSDNPLELWGDGEFVCRLPATVRVAHRSLRVCGRGGI